MITDDVRVHRAVLGASAGPFRRLTTRLDRADDDGTVLVEVRVAGAAVTAEWLYPFSWDAGDRGVVTGRRMLGLGDQLCLHAGPYGTADASAHRDGVPMEFPIGGDGHRYRSDAVLPPQPDDDHQDAAAWVVVGVDGRCVVLAWEYSGHLTTTVGVEADEVVIITRLPIDTYAPIGGRHGPGPIGWLAVVEGGLDAGAAALRTLITTEMITAPDLTGMPGEPAFPCLVANSWGVEENTSTERILAMMDATAVVGAEVFVVDKGWERLVGDWHENARFGAGLGWLSAQARARGLGFGIWCGWGNADARSPVATEHPDWLATWRGQVPVLSFDNHALCLGHDPVRDWVLGELVRMVPEFGLTWTLHDFETIARCDSTAHTHDPGAGEHAAEAAFHHILAELRRRFPTLVLENCWNGVRPLDLAMIKSHHTTITEDHCRTHFNALAKVGLGRYLPLDWQSAYMGADSLPTRARIAPYVIGGPWVLMDDPERWTEEDRALIGRACAVFRGWRRVLRDGVISRPAVEPAAVDAVAARAEDGRVLLAVSVPPGIGEIRLSDFDGADELIDEWTGEPSSLDLNQPIPVSEDGDGLILSLRVPTGCP